VTSFSRAGEGTWDAEVVSGPGGFLIAQQQQQQPKSTEGSASGAEAAAAAPAPALPVAAAAPEAAAAAPAAAPAAPPSSPAAAADAGGVSLQRWDWVAADSAAAAEAESVKESELAAMFAEEVEKKEKAFEEEEN
jgi:hypothetical protein